MSEEKKIVEESSNENIASHASKEEIKQKPKETKTKAKKNKEVKKQTASLVLPEIAEVKEVVKKEVTPSIPKAKVEE